MLNSDYGDLGRIFFTFNDSFHSSASRSSNFLHASSASLIERQHSLGLITRNPTRPEHLLFQSQILKYSPRPILLHKVQVTELTKDKYTNLNHLPTTINFIMRICEAVVYLPQTRQRQQPNPQSRPDQALDGLRQTEATGCRILWCGRDCTSSRLRHLSMPVSSRSVEP